MNRRTLVRVLVVVGIGIPIIVEGVTFAALMEDGFAEPTATPSPSPTPSPAAGVGVGEDLLDGTAVTATVTDARVAAGAESWTFVLSVHVENGEEAPVAVQLEAVTLASEESVDGGVTTDRIQPGESTTVAAQWSLPAGATPRAVDVVAVRYEDGGSTVIAEETVRLAKVPVQRG